LRTGAAITNFGRFRLLAVNTSLALVNVVTVTVWGRPELSGKRVIGPDGEIQLPFVGSFRVAGLNADDAGAKLTSALRED